MARVPAPSTIGMMDAREHRRALRVDAIDCELRLIVRRFRLLEQDCELAEVRLAAFALHLAELRRRLLADVRDAHGEPVDPSYGMTGTPAKNMSLGSSAARLTPWPKTAANAPPANVRPW
jgi:hypothetical protein